MTISEMLELIDNEEYSAQVLHDSDSERARRLGVLGDSLRGVIESHRTRRICCPLIESSVAAGSFIYMYGDDDRLDEAERHRRALLRSGNALLRELQQLDSRQFEELCGVVLQRIGCHNVTVTRSQGDDGVDAVAELPLVETTVDIGTMSSMQRLVAHVSFLVYFQAKRYAAGHPVEKEEVHELVGSWETTRKEFMNDTLAPENKQALKLADYRAADPVLLVLGTTSRFTTGAKKRGDAAGVILLDGEQMVQILIDLHIGARVNDEFDVIIDLSSTPWER